MEGVEFTTPTLALSANKQPSSIQTSVSSSSLGPAFGVSASIHAPANAVASSSASLTTKVVPDVSMAGVSGPSSTKQADTKWVTVQKRQTFAVALALGSLPGATNDEKKNYAYNMIGSIPHMLSVVISKINDVGVIKVSYSVQESATAATQIPVSDSDTAHFEPINNLSASQIDNQYQLKIIGVPLDIDKPIFTSYLNKIGATKQIKFLTRGLYFHVHVTFASKDVSVQFQDKWSLTFGKHMFRIFPNDISTSERNLRSKFTLKLTNLPKGTTAFDLSAILEEVSAKTCFIPKKRDSRNYDKERFAIVQFASETALNQAVTFSYVLRNRAVQ